MIRILVLFAMLWPVVSFSQGYIPTLTDGNHWEIRRDLGLGTYMQWDYALACDTSIGSRTYAVIREMDTDTIIGFAREDTLAQEVFYLAKGSGQEELIISYALNTGDTITIRGYLWSVDSVKNEFKYGAERKVIYLDALVRFVEGVGSPWLGILTEVFPGYGGPFQYVNDIYPTEPDCATTALEETSMKKIIELYPNPFDDYIHVQVNGTHSESILIYSITGQLVETYLIPSSMQIDTKKLSPGMYLIKLSGGGVGKVIKN